jgi:hypothetical protein
MTNGYLTFLDYLELRRRVEKWLASGNLLLLHTLVFGIGATALGIIGFQSYYNPFDYYYVDPSMGHIVGLWSGILLLHGLWFYWRSGAHGGRRDQTIASEMRERLQNDDLYLSDHPKDLFRLHNLLNNDIRIRASMIPVLVFFSFLNVLIWLPWALNDAHSPWAWTNAQILIVPLLLALGWNFAARRRHEVKLRQQMEQLFGSQQTQSSEDEYGAEREMRLSENDELVTVDEYMMKRKRN